VLGSHRVPDEWTTLYGRRWPLLIFVLAAVLVLRGALESLTDPDLPMHLALGEWIVEHRAVPTIEPFAWTRPGQPFFAYSWGIEVVLHLLADVWGATALRVVHGLSVAGAFVAMVFMGREARWDPRTTLVMAVMNVTVLDFVVNSLRPQAWLFTLVPLAWALVLRALRDPKPALWLAALAITSAVAVNTHIFFPLTALGWMSWIANPPRDQRRILLVVLATVAGWLVSPHTLLWPEILDVNAQTNAMLERPSPISELQPGFSVARESLLVFPMTLFLVSLPWLTRSRIPTRRAAFLYGSAWLIGLIEFAQAARLLLVWWLLVLPLAALAISRVVQYLMSSEAQSVRLWRITAVWAVCAVLIITASPFDGDARAFENFSKRRFSPLRANGLDHVASWLECNTLPDARGRVFTRFDYGSALTWRLPQYSMSIDGRTIFPDSVAKPEAFYELFGEPLREGPWRTADLAILTEPSSAGEILRNHSQWMMAAVAHRADASAALWVTTHWWEKWGRSPVGSPPAALMPGGELAASGACSPFAHPARERLAMDPND
jgi:hypothetical protein